MQGEGALGLDRLTSADEMEKSFGDVAKLIRKESDAIMEEVRREHSWKLKTERTGRRHIEDHFKGLEIEMSTAM